MHNAQYITQIDISYMS